MAPIDVAPRSLAPSPSSPVVCRPRTTGTFQRFQTGRPLSRRTPGTAAVTTAWGISILRYGRGRRHRHPHASADGKASSESSASEEGSASQAPNDRDVDHKFTAQFNAYTAAYFSPHRRLWRWARWRLKGLWPQKSKVQARPSGVQRTIAVVGYLLPLGVALRLLVPPTFVGQSSLANLWLCLLTITSPISSPLGALTAASWLVCSLTDQEPCDFIRCHFRQALMLTSVSALLVFLERAPSPPDLGGEGRVPLVLSTTRNSLLGALLFWWLISVCCCLLGRCIGTVRNDLNGSRLVES